ncbi:3796_t:CDS:2 [Racocetra fulgida]|uniref:3796_t:CDS:1 n=1 Tax=Racocetra fulgida TaxID=60492 RepID=A0A9N8ZSM2_9GLOM|nr:3796_t:CDS:2 [Racocetra fulgida]
MTNLSSQQNSDDNRKAEPITFELGVPIHISWTASQNHTRRDWIGIYKVTSNSSKLVTNVSSRGRFVYVSPEEGEVVDSGEVWFKGDLLPWETGTYEFRYHHDDGYEVMTISQPFEIADDLHVIEQSVLTLVQRVLDSDSTHTTNNDYSDSKISKIPNTTSDDYILMKEIHAKHIVYGIKMMFGIDFAWEVVSVDGNVGRLAQRVCILFIHFYC